MAVKSKKPVKKAVSTKSKTTKASTKRRGIIASPKKRFSLSPKQWALTGVAGFIALTGAVYFLVQSQEQTTADAASCVSNVYKQGSKSTCVKYMQQLVNASGTAGKISADGVFGAGTKSAVVKFQKAKKLTADGIVGSGTWGKLCGVSGAADAKKGAGCSSSSSTAKKWQVVKTVLLTDGARVASGGDTVGYLNTSTFTLTKNHTYRACISGYNTRGGSNTQKVSITKFGSATLSTKLKQVCSASKTGQGERYTAGQFGVYWTGGLGLVKLLNNFNIEEYK